MTATPVTDDDWALSYRESEKRATMIAEAKIAHRRMIWEGIGMLLGAVIAVTGVLGVCWFFYDSVNGTREGDIRIEVERTEQVKACVDLNEPLERQYCLLAINVPNEEP